jgi:hypothetical protein
MEEGNGWWLNGDRLVVSQANPDSMAQLRKELRERIVGDQKMLDDMRAQVRSGLAEARR